METIAENKTVITKSVYRQAASAISGTGKMLRIGMVVLAGVWVAFFAFTMATHGNVSLAMFQLAILAVAFSYVVYHSYSRNKKGYKKMMLRHRNVPERTMYFYDDHLQVDSDGFLEEFPYETIKKIVSTKKLLILVTEGGLGIIVSRDGFTKGNSDLILNKIQSHIGGSV